MDAMTCPKCSAEMTQRSFGEATVARCSACSGVFLDRADLGALSEAENDWHLSSGPQTAPLPRITAEMTAPPASSPRARSFLETLFTG